jgi:predicted nuclease of predicted toxin-antitoxin system
VKLLFDANISRRIVRLLDDLFPESTHITLVGLAGETDDETIWEFASENGLAIVTADADFLKLSDTRGAPPKVIRLERMDYSTEVAAALIRRYAVAINEFGKSAKLVLVLRRN